MDMQKEKVFFFHHVLRKAIYHAQQGYGNVAFLKKLSYKTKTFNYLISIILKS